MKVKFLLLCCFGVRFAGLFRNILNFLALCVCRGDREKIQIKLTVQEVDVCLTGSSYFYNQFSFIKAHTLTLSHELSSLQMF